MKRRIISLLLVCSMILTLVSLVACNDREIPDPTDSEDNTESNDSSESSESAKTTKKTSGLVSEEDMNKYSVKKFTQAIWSGNVSYAEAALVKQNSDKVVEPIKLLYDIQDVISVRSADLKTLYEEGTDYKVTSDGKLEIIKGGNIPVLKYEDYYFSMTAAEHQANQLSSKVPAREVGMGYILAEQFNSGKPGMSQWAIAVTYKHAEGSCAVSIPDDRSDKFTAIINKLEAKEKIKVVALGDSITHGWSSSKNANMAPYCPNYPGLFNDYVSMRYKVTPTYVNLAKSGMSSQWAIDGNYYVNGVLKNDGIPIDKLCEEDPDLVFLAFGMNDACYRETAEFVENINTMLDKIKNECPNAMVVVVGTMLPNTEVRWSPGGDFIFNYHADYEVALKEAEAGWTNAVFANVTQAHREMMTVKTYQDTTGSNTNHPNDYFHRVYANVMIQTVFGYK